ncbi:MAG: hypothetical protein M1815_002509 [Lichina confinis]|nr:MAG: hypothetical protein M1815_002509 [Lichina confinis]
MIADVSASREGLLHGRGDALALLDPRIVDDSTAANTAAENVSLLILLSRSRSSIAAQVRDCVLHVLAVGREGPHGIPSGHAPIRPLCQFHLPSTTADQTSINKASLDVGSGSLQLLRGSSLASYDLSGTYPKLVSELDIPGGGTHSFLRISQALTLTTTRSTLAIYDVCYRTIRLSSPVDLSALRPSSGTKRKRTVDDVHSQPAAMELLSFLPRSGLVVGRIDGQLVGFNITFSGIERSRKRRAGNGKLLDALGQGISSAKKDASLPSLEGRIPSSLGSSLSLGSASDPSWEQKRELLNRYTERQHFQNFERLVAGEVGISRNETHYQQWRIARKEEGKERRKAQSHCQSHETNGGAKTNGTHPHKRAADASKPRVRRSPVQAPIPTWKWPQHADGTLKTAAFRRIAHSKSLFIIGQLFSFHQQEDAAGSSGEAKAEKSTESRLRIKFCTPNVFRWLMFSGNLTLRNIELALQSFEAAAEPFSVRVRGEALVRAILEMGPSVDLLLWAFEGPVFTNAEEIISAAKPLMVALSESSTLDLPALPGTGPNPADGGGKLPETDQAADTGVEGHGPSAKKKPDARAVLEKALALALNRLRSCPYPQITRAFGQVLTRAELILVVQLLRRNLIIGGWTSWQLDNDPIFKNNTGHECRDVHFISSLLGCALDSIGAAGWIHAGSGFGGLVDPSSLMAVLQLEVSAALEAVQEAASLEALLKELLHHGKSAKSGNSSGGDRSRSKQRGEIVVLQAEAPGPKALPLGSRPKDETPSAKIIPGGRVAELSKRDLQLLESKKVGPYTMERITI